MATPDMNSGMDNIDDTDSDWPSVKANAVISVILSYLSVIIGGLGLYTVFFKAWQSFPLVGIAWILWGISCVGLRRLSTPRGEFLRRNTN